ncbi:hypothetical protein N7465_006037 [Penicillium sp. CMV-2018d]|nr:hypothetical protein N7465_006037 [Penicillium sp. CMV-2018d]
MSNAVFLPILYFYPKTDMFRCSALLFLLLIVIVASRCLEDLDASWLSVSGDPDAICQKCLQEYIDREDEEAMII